MKILLFLLLLAAPLLAQDHKHHHDFSEIDKWVKVFEEPGRDKWQKPAEVVEWLKLQPNQVVADVGAASGYFSRALARAVPRGQVIAVEIEPGFFAPIHRLAHEEKLFNIVTSLCTEGSPCLPAASVDMIFICDTLHHIEKRSAYYEEIKKCLKPGGRLVIVEFFKDRKIPFGPRPAERLEHGALAQELEGAGFQTRLNLDLLPYQYILEGTL